MSANFPSKKEPEWVYTLDGIKSGPFNDQEIGVLIGKGIIKRDTVVSNLVNHDSRRGDTWWPELFTKTDGEKQGVNSAQLDDVVFQLRESNRLLDSIWTDVRIVMIIVLIVVAIWIFRGLIYVFVP